MACGFFHVGTKQMCIGWKLDCRSLVTAGEMFNPFGYALIMPRVEGVPAKHIAFSQVIQYIKENGQVMHTFHPKCGGK